MNDRPESRRTGAVQCDASIFRTLTGGNLTSERYQILSLPQLLPSDQKRVSQLFTPLRLMFPDLEWDDWGVEIVEGNDCLVEVLSDEFTCVIDRRVLSDWPLLAWEAFRAFVESILTDNYSRYLEEPEIRQLSLSLQLAWFAHESEVWQLDLLDSLQKHANNAHELQDLLLTLVSPDRAHNIGASSNHELPELRPNEPPFWPLLQAHFPMAFEQRSVDAETTWPSRWERFLRAFSVRSPIPWQGLCNTVPGSLFRYANEVDPKSNSTTRRLSLFRIVVEQQHTLDEPYWRVSALDWAQSSLLILDPQRHPKISCALHQFLETVEEESSSVLWPINIDECRLAQLASSNRLSEEDDRFFRQATHLQAIWRDILHRNSSQDWASNLLFDALERTTRCLRAEPELIFVALICNRSMWEHSSAAQSPMLRNLRELLWILSQAPLSVLRRMFPRDLKESEEAQQSWPMIRRYIKRFLHLAPPILSRSFEQLDEVRSTRTIPASTGQQFHLDTDPDIPHQELHGRIVPLLSRPELRDYHQLNMDDVAVLRIVSLDKHLSQGSGLWRDQRFFRSFLLLFKTEDNLFEGNWFHLALWIDKEIDLIKLSQKNELPSTVSGLMQEEGIWEQTYRYQFLTVDQLMHRLKTNTQQWGNVLNLLGDEYEDLMYQRLREVLDFHFYLNHFQQSLEPGTEASHPFWHLPMESFENQKHEIIREATQLVLAEFYRMHLQDKCSWLTAEQNINHLLSEASELFTIPTGTLTVPPENASVLHRSLASVFQSWSEDSVDNNSHELNDMEEAWLMDKRALLQRMEQYHPEQAVLWVRCLLEQFNQNYRVMELLLPTPLADADGPSVFKPLGELQHQNEATREMVPFLCDATGHLVSPLFLRSLSHVPIPLLRKTMELHPSLFPPLQHATQLLRELDRDSDQHIQLWNTLEDLRQARQRSQQAAKKKLPTEAELPKETTTPD